MAKMCLSFFALVLVVVVALPGVLSECKEILPAGLKTDWFTMPQKWYVPMADDISQSDLFGVNPKSMGNGGEKTICFSAIIKASGSPLPTPIGYICNYGTSANTQVCKKSDSSSLDKTVFQNFPQQLAVKIVATDNSTYALASGCFGGKLDTWALMSTTTEPSAEAKQMTETLFPMKEGSQAASFKFDSTEIVECGKNALGLQAISLGRFTKKSGNKW